MLRPVLLSILTCVLFSTVSTAERKTVFRCDFDAHNLSGSGQGRLAPGKTGKSLFIELDTPGTLTRKFVLDASMLAGKYITLRASAKAADVSAPPNPWNGIKVMLVLNCGGANQYPQIDMPVGTFEWIERSKSLRVSRQLEHAVLVVGLESVSGRAWFDNIEILVGRPERKGRRFETKFTGHDLPRLRGVMHGPTFRAEDIEELATKWGANQIRWQLNWVPMKKAEDWAQDLDAYDKWLDGALIECDKALDASEKHRIRVLVDLHTPPGGRKEGGICRMFSEKKYQDKLLSVWDRIAGRYKGREIVYAYDLLNEAVEGPVAPELMNWRELATEVTKVIRRIDPAKPVVFEPSPWGGPDGFETLEPLDVDRVIYSFHMYRPHNFTHQGVHNDKTGIAYPGVIDGQMWNKERLREEMAGVIDFQRYYNVQIYVGEFSAIRWGAPRQCVQLPAGSNKPVRTVRLGLVLSRISRMGRLECRTRNRSQQPPPRRRTDQTKKAPAGIVLEEQTVKGVTAF